MRDRKLAEWARTPVAEVPEHDGLRLIGGLATDEIARAFLVKEATMAPRLGA